MRHRLWKFGSLLLACGALGTSARVVGAQQADPAPPAVEASAPARTQADQALPGEVLPRVYELKDKDGKYQAVPGFTFEDFMELFRLKNQLAQQNRQPDTILQDLTISGTVSAGRVELLARYAFTLRATGWVRVPLRLATAVLREQPVYDGPGLHLVRFERDGYEGWVRADAGTTHTINLKLLVPLVHVGPEAHLQLSVPRALVSRCMLQVPLAHAVAKVSDGTTLESVRPLEDGTSELNMVGISGEFEVAWHAAESQVARLPTILEANGAQSIRVNGRTISTDARLSVRSFGGEFDRFQVRLPPGADYVGAAQAGVALVAVDGDAAKGRLYEVRLEKKTSGPAEIRLLTERVHDDLPAEELFELAGFEVVGAVRQWGTVTVATEGNLQIVWGPANHVRQADETVGPLRRDGLMAGLEYFVQPYSLTARFVPQKTRVRVEPEYVLLVGSDEAQLRCKLKYTIRGAKIRELEFEAPGWEIDTVGPSTLVNVDVAIDSQADPLVIPLLQATSGEIELTVEAHRKISAAEGITLKLPRVRGDTIAPAIVAVVPADNLELVWRPEQSTALASQAVRPQVKLPESQQDPLFFRTDGAGAEFVASVSIHEQAISTTVATKLEIEERETKVDAKITYQIAYQPADHLMLGLPRAIQPDRLNITLDGQRLLPAPLRDRPEGDAVDVVPIRVPLPAPRIGRCELQVSYLALHEKLTTTANTTVNVPLVVPGEGQLTGNELTVAAKPEITVSYSKGPWSEDAHTSRAANGASLVLTARRAIAEVSLAAISKERQVEDSTTIQRAWIQTRLTETQRRDRAIFRFTTSEPKLKLALPEGVDLGTLVVEIDARRITWDLDRQRDLVVALPGTSGGEHLLELRYHFTDPQPFGLTLLSAPQLKSARWLQQMYWHLTLPATEHVLLAPAHYTCEFSWVWSDWFWRRQPSLNERELASWIGAAPIVAPAGSAADTDLQRVAAERQSARSANCYLFSTVGAVEPLQFYSFSRARLVLLASLPILVGGLLLIYFPTARHPAGLFALAVLVVASSLADPDLALIVAQASSLGVVLTIIAALMARLSARAQPASISVHGSSMAVDRSTAELYQRPPASGSHPSTVPPLVPTATPDVEP